ncbi:MAG TPA: hypothetical protein VI731_11300 [Bacteroidia bacterium]|nr:hypothetical protein [Bacteroidia bacterium]
MKRLFLVFGLLLTIAAVHAQNVQTPATQQTPQETRAHNKALKMQKALGLSTEQTTKVEAVFLSRITEVDKVYADATLTAEQQQAKIVTIDAAKEKELESIMTSDQYTRYKDMQKK